MLHFLSVSFCPLLISSPLLYPILSHPFRPLLQLMLLWHWCKCLSRVLCCCCRPVLYHSTQIIYTFFLFYSLSYHDRVDQAMRDRVVVVTFRLACGIPPILLSFFCSRLKLIETYAGSISIPLPLFSHRTLAYNPRRGVKTNLVLLARHMIPYFLNRELQDSSYS